MWELEFVAAVGINDLVVDPHQRKVNQIDLLQVVLVVRLQNTVN